MKFALIAKTVHFDQSHTKNYVPFHPRLHRSA